MKHLLLTTIAAVVLVGCGPSASERALLNAAESGNIESVKQQLAAGTNANAKDENRWIPLHYAAKYGRKETIELLIAKGADMNANSDDYGTPLNWAINGRQAETINFLRKHGGKTREELKAEGK